MAPRGSLELDSPVPTPLPLLQHSHKLLAPELKFAGWKTATSKQDIFLCSPFPVAKGKGCSWLGRLGKQSTGYNLFSGANSSQQQT